MNVYIYETKMNEYFLLQIDLNVILHAMVLSSDILRMSPPVVILSTII